MANHNITLFSDLKFYVPPDLDESGKLRNILCDNGGILTDALSDDDENDNVLFILDSFERENELFTKLIGKGRSIVSSKCIYDSIKDNKPLPENIKYPLFARFMEGLTICLPNCGEIEKEVGTLVRYMGGQYVETIDSTDYLLAKKVGSIQYQLAQQHCIPIVSPDWVHECWASQSLLPVKKFLLPPFAGCVISVTGLSASTRNEIQRLSKAYGGEYTPNLTKRCTHLISQFPQGIKYRYALEWGIHCVSIHWFFDSINLQVCADETRYFLPMSEATRQALFNPMSTSPRDLNRLSPALRKKHLMQLHRKRRSPPHPYDLYIISGGPFPRMGSASTTPGIPGITGIRPFPTESRKSNRSAPRFSVRRSVGPSLMEVKSEEEDEEDEETTNAPTLKAVVATAKGEMENSASGMEGAPGGGGWQVAPVVGMAVDGDGGLIGEELDGNQETISEINKLIELCTQTIDHYTELAKTTDLSPLVPLLNHKSPKNNNQRT